MTPKLDFSAVTSSINNLRDRLEKAAYNVLYDKRRFDREKCDEHEIFEDFNEMAYADSDDIPVISLERPVKEQKEMAEKNGTVYAVNEKRPCSDYVTELHTRIEALRLFPGNKKILTKLLKNLAVLTICNYQREYYNCLVTFDELLEYLSEFDEESEMNGEPNPIDDKVNEEEYGKYPFSKYTQELFYNIQNGVPDKDLEKTLSALLRRAISIRHCITAKEYFDQLQLIDALIKSFSIES